VRGSDDQPKIVMSSSAYNGFTEEQKEQLAQFGKLVPIPIDNAIEFVGGGSARCMLAEVFLPRQQEVAVDPLDALCWFFLSSMQQQEQVVAQEIPAMHMVDTYYDPMIEGVAV